MTVLHLNFLRGSLKQIFQYYIHDLERKFIATLFPQVYLDMTLKGLTKLRPTFKQKGRNSTTDSFGKIKPKKKLLTELGKYFPF